MQQEHVTIYGDYDVDGVTGTSVLYTVLRRLGAPVDFTCLTGQRRLRTQSQSCQHPGEQAPDQAHHHLRLRRFQFCRDQFCPLVGSGHAGVRSPYNAGGAAAAVGIVHPKRLDEAHPLFHLPGVGVAYKVCEALLIDQGHDDEVKQLLDYVTLGMIADMVPLIRENRYLVKIGLPALARSPRPGIQALLSQCGKMEDTDIVGFGLAPRINAVGKIGRRARSSRVAHHR